MKRQRTSDVLQGAAGEGAGVSNVRREDCAYSPGGCCNGASVQRKRP